MKLSTQCDGRALLVDNKRFGSDPGTGIDYCDETADVGNCMQSIANVVGF